MFAWCCLLLLTASKNSFKARWNARALWNKNQRLQLRYDVHGKLERVCSSDMMCGCCHLYSEKLCKFETQPHFLCRRLTFKWRHLLLQYLQLPNTWLHPKPVNHSKSLTGIGTSAHMRLKGFFHRKDLLFRHLLGTHFRFEVHFTDIKKSHNGDGHQNSWLSASFTQQQTSQHNAPNTETKLLFSSHTITVY